MQQIYKNRSLKNLPDEKWEYITEYGDRYQISNMGRVKSVRRFIFNPSNGGYYNKAKIMGQTMNPFGYLYVALTKDGIPHKYFVHCLVALPFVPNPENKPFVNHKKGIKWDNRASELEWMTALENMRHSFDTGLNHRGEKCHQAKITQEQANEIRAKYIHKIYGLTKLGLEYGIDISSVYKIVRNKTYKTY
jgi:hypothetical protein